MTPAEIFRRVCRALPFLVVFAVAAAGMAGARATWPGDDLASTVCYWAVALGFTAFVYWYVREVHRK